MYTLPTIMVFRAQILAQSNEPNTVTSYFYVMKQACPA